MEGRGGVNTSESLVMRRRGGFVLAGGVVGFTFLLSKVGLRGRGENNILVMG